MPNLVKEKIIANLEKGTVEGKTRVENIREILKDAVSQTVAELKEGTDEIGIILKDAISTAIIELKKTGRETGAEITASIEGVIEGVTHYRQDAIAQLQLKLQEVQALIDEQKQQLDQEIEGVIIDVKATEHNDSADIESALNTAVNTVKERQELARLQQQYLNLKFQLANMEQKLQICSGDRYNEIKKQLDNVKIWYEKAKIEAEASGINLLQHKQTEIESNISEFASVVARTEQEIKQRLHQLIDNRE